MHNLAAALFGVAAREMARIVTLMGGGPDKVIGLPGVQGNSIVTCVGGRTIRLGRLLWVGADLSRSGVRGGPAACWKRAVHRPAVGEASYPSGRRRGSSSRTCCRYPPLIRVITAESPAG